MTKSRAAALLAAAALAAIGTEQALQETCVRISAWVPCGHAQALGAECVDPTSPERLTPIVADVPIPEGTEPEPTPGIVISTVAPITCYSDEPVILPIEHGPLIGHVGRHATEDTPEEPPKLGVCEGSNCYCATEPCRRILPGDPYGSADSGWPTWKVVLKQMHPELFPEPTTEPL